MSDAASFDAILQYNMLEVFCEALGAAILVTDRLDNIVFASARLLQFFPLRENAIEPGKRARDLYGALYDAGCRIGNNYGKLETPPNRNDWIGERIATSWKERSDSIERYGADRWLHFVSRRFSSGIGFTVLQDISEHKKKEHLWRAESERVRITEEILDTLPVAVAVKDRNLSFVAVNQEFCRLHETTPDVVLGRNVWDFLDAETAGVIEKSDWQLLSAGGDHTDKVEIERPNGDKTEMLRIGRRIGKPGKHYISLTFSPTETPSDRAFSVAPTRGDEANLRKRPETGSFDAAGDKAGQTVADPRQKAKNILMVIGNTEAAPELPVIAKRLGAEACVLENARELAAFLPAAQAAGIQIDLILHFAEDSDSAKVAAASGVRTIALSDTDENLVTMISKALDASDETIPAPAKDLAPPPGRPSVVREMVPVDILAIEDNTINRMALEQIAESLGLSIVLAASAEEGLLASRTQQFSLLLVDLTLPDATLGETINKLRDTANAREAPIVAMIPHDSEDERKACNDAGASAILTKPLDPEALDRAFRQLVLNVVATSSKRTAA
ncbi:response regulator [Rhizobium alvei]|uniref:Response regulator n=1 Tax=Rhizobium alvei TaxID=1132659 RepID=A0ABT8YGU2_9HYPH|nr:response regulator [Rhizobium alvei]MDO6962485.1 response regulator [Rhizobium alvei]